MGQVQMILDYPFYARFCFFFNLTLFFLLRQSFTLSPRLECSGTISANCNLRLLGSRNSPALESQVAGTIGSHHHAWLIFIFLVEMGFDMLARLVLNPLPQVICLPQPPKLLGLAGVSHHPGLNLEINFQELISLC